jgi:hypothetical protein
VIFIDAYKFDSVNGLESFIGTVAKFCAGIKEERHQGENKIK